ncbi:hypothetical protein FBY36_0288 [Arthrobacter sp. SLBN-122]|nr:hypothetical protein FBY36_0288 [Arthrobacter sp. SLBN-122]
MPRGQAVHPLLFDLLAGALLPARSAFDAVPEVLTLGPPPKRPEGDRTARLR